MAVQPNPDMIIVRKSMAFIHYPIFIISTNNYNYHYILIIRSSEKGFAPHTGARAIPPTLLYSTCLMDFSCALDGSRESVKCQVKSAE